MKRPKAVNVLALLLDYKNARFPDFGPTDEFTLEWQEFQYMRYGNGAEAKHEACGSRMVRRPFYVPFLVRYVTIMECDNMRNEVSV